MEADVWVLDYKNEDDLLSGNDCTFVELTLDVQRWEDPSTTQASTRPRDCTSDRYAVRYEVTLKAGWGGSPQSPDAGVP